MSINQILKSLLEWKKKNEKVLTPEQLKVSDEIEDLLSRARPWHERPVEELEKLKGGEAELFGRWQEDYQKAMLKAIKCDLELLSHPIVEDWITVRKLLGQWNR